MSVSDWDTPDGENLDEMTTWQFAIREIKDRVALWMGRDPLSHDWFFRPRRNPGRLLGRLTAGLCMALVIASGAIMWLGATPPASTHHISAAPHARHDLAAREGHS